MYRFHIWDGAYKHTDTDIHIEERLNIHTCKCKYAIKQSHILFSFILLLIANIIIPYVCWIT